MDQTTNNHSHGSLIVGLILVAVGVVFLLDNFDIIYIGEPITRFWPVLVIGLGLARIVQAETPSERRRGFFWTFIGLWLLVSVLHMFDLNFHNSWPILLIGLGINSIWKAVDPQPECRLSKG
ncbi:MAG TPA: hypothetical protein DEP53_04480 [Bacteroidetes bacterium]|nr:hypothetical protein [Bacteroidota bacterium]